MDGKSGDRAKQSGEYSCDGCGTSVHVDKNDKFPDCPDCGSTTFTSSQKQEEQERKRKAG